ncbi:phosphate transport system substrate-binding protein [Actinobaculum suis]|uniref:Phosphate-binding protein n=1 Tax=Actinobaculum suis TaxID=1657 RepID=A0A0K9ES52_9ACTO|nr:phosphate ABC transporter substrate-binding protein PstS [Actinobaculum suis]KMY22720.1 phosphate ABC transporter substrate-binding protein [Actinobaculum suis]MDY5152584.1 phosphate ABC transporter substrate-binding protein PstS [Actinobaculum suis]OCA94334.1 phosphate ABC transporter substrate-binding protein PstS [Actinobaculum suis]OCA95164.1 phosphate ABC transporter substrate-binding protein PstS [Actinobaculum suis]SDE13328.1 phosphate transport system substrate-binding protein [Acti
MKIKKFTALAAASALAFTLTACGGDANSGNKTTESATTEAATNNAGSSDSGISGTINGSGASSQVNAQQAWRDAFVQKNSGATVNYEPTGSGTGREQFLTGKVAYAGTDSIFDEEELAKVGQGSQCASDVLIELPVYISPIAVAYNLPGVDNLNLTGETVAKIFKGEIKKWNDAAIAETNQGVNLPDLDIIPVNRSDDSGTSKNFQGYLQEAAPDVWTDKPSDTWPITGTQSAQQTSGVVNLVKTTEGAITYADYSQIGDLKAAKLQVGSDFVGPTPEAAAAIVDGSPATEDATDTRLTVDLKRDGSIEDAYPAVMISYLVACQDYKDASVGSLVKEFFTYVVSAEGQERAASAKGGNAPISDALRKEAEAAIAKIK